ncbi:hypothetical protein [Thermoproteus tenax]|uniref:hypothetical protein n=1 Tax=Thermoproteus tenax TaxID=2271 RepID=UPI0014332C43|nr:hypothetical protein [Thermoproteus tenax]
MEELVEIVRYLESQESYRLIDVIKYRNGRRYIFKVSIRDGEIYIHLISHRGRAYLELWLQSFAVPLAVYDLNKDSLSIPISVVELLKRS